MDITWNRRNYDQHLGAHTRPDPASVVPPHAIRADNCVFYEGEVHTRNGFGEAYNVNATAHALYNWVTSLGNYIVYWTQGSGLRMRDIASPSTLTSFSVSGGWAAVFANTGSWLYVAHFGTDNKGASTGRVLVKQSGTFYLDQLFPGPITTTAAASEPVGAGVVTAGIHRLAYAIQYRGGFIGKLCPDSGSGTPGINDTLAYVSITASGSKKIEWTINPGSWPTGAVKVHVAMSPVSSPNDFIFVPDAEQTISGSSPVTFTINISDEDLIAAQGQNDASKHRFLYTSTVGGTAPFNPGCIFPYGDRMVYITSLTDVAGQSYSAVFASERGQHQHITVDLHSLKIPAGVQLVTGFEMNGSAHFFGPQGTFRTVDNRLDPVQWSQLVHVDTRGTNSVRGVCVNAQEGYAWVADVSGLYLYDGGGYSGNPISLRQAEWSRINWGVAYSIQVIDDVQRQVVYVVAPIDDDATHTIFSWNYRDGKDPYRANFSKWTVSNYTVASAAMVQNDLGSMPNQVAKEIEFWLGGTTNLRRLKSDHDSAPYTDGSSDGIAWTYETGNIGDGRSHQVVRHHAIHLRVLGSGTLAITALNSDDTWSKTMNSVTLSTAPGKDWERGIDRMADRLRLRFATSAAGAYCKLKGFTHYWSSALLKR